MQTALSSSVSGQQIWVKAGVHKPGTARTDTFSLKNGVAVYGGFAGTETALSQRNWQTNVTILSGDIDNNDINTDMNNIAELTSDIVGGNSYNLITAYYIDATAVLDGVIVTAGQSSGPDHILGGGMVAYSSTPILNNLIFSGNYASGLGGGLSNWESSPNLTNVVFTGNHSVMDGGGMFNEGGAPHLTNVVFIGNSAEGNGGGMANSGAATPLLTNATLVGNSAAQSGGAIVNFSRSTPTILNSILWGNSAENGPQMYSLSYPLIAYSDIQGSGGSGSGWNGGLGTDGGHNLDLDPAFWDAGGLDNIYGNRDDNPRLRLGSPAINSGDATAVPAGVSTDLDGNPRLVQNVDMGAYEYQTPGVHILYAAVSASGSGNCSSWLNACTLPSALSAATAGDQIWVKAGVYKPGAARTNSFS